MSIQIGNEKEFLKIKNWAMKNDMVYRYYLITNNIAHGTSKAVKKVEFYFKLKTVMIILPVKTFFFPKKLNSTILVEIIFNFAAF